MLAQPGYTGITIIHGVVVVLERIEGPIAKPFRCAEAYLNRMLEAGIGVGGPKGLIRALWFVCEPCYPGVIVSRKPTAQEAETLLGEYFCQSVNQPVIPTVWAETV